VTRSWSQSNSWLSGSNDHPIQSLQQVSYGLLHIRLYVILVFALIISLNCHNNAMGKVLISIFQMRESKPRRRDITFLEYPAGW
jgi:hypothetical protein